MSIRLKVLSVALVLLTDILTGSHDFPMSRSVLGQDSPASANVRFSIDLDSRLGAWSFVPGQWGEFQLRLENREPTAREILCSSYFDGQSSMQFGRKFWLPAQSRLVLRHPVKIPAGEHFPDGVGSVRSMLTDQTGERDVTIKSGSGQVQHQRPLRVTSAGRNTAVMAGWEISDVVEADIFDLVAASRVYQGLTTRLSYLAGQFLPADEASLEYLDHLVIAENRLVDDPAGLTAVRRWLHSGGRLWVMLDRADPIVLERLLGDEFTGGLIDRVDLNSIQIDQPPSSIHPGGVIGQVAEYEEPIRMARVVMPDMEVRKTVNGWPAALTTTYGEGRILITTLGPRAWVKMSPFLLDGAIEDTRPPESRSEFVPTPPMEGLAGYILSPRTPEALPPENLESFAREYVSLSVPAWTLVNGMMAGFLLLLLLLGGVFFWVGKLEHFAWTGSLLSVVFGAVFLNIGVSNKGDAPEAIANFQFAQAIAGTDDVRTHGTAVVYRTEGGATALETSRGGRCWPDTSAIDDTTRRMITTDLDAFHWENVSQTSELGAYEITTSGAFVDRIAAQATIDSEGISGSFTGLASSGADAILVSRRGRIGVHATSDGQFKAGPDDVLKPDQFLKADLLNDVQDRRQRVLQQLINNGVWKKSLEQPQLLLWMPDWEHGFGFGDGLQRQGDTLVAVPLHFRPSTPGTEIVLPGPLLDFSSGQPPDGSSVAGFWDDGRQEWQERSRPSTTWLNVQVPPDLMPLRATRLRVEISVSGLMGQLEMLGVKDGEVVSLHTITDPVGTVYLESEDAESLTVSDDGKLLLGVTAGVDPDAVGGAEQARSANGSASPAITWKFESLSLQLWAVATELTEEN